MDAILRITSRIMSVLIMLRIPSLLATSNAMEEVPTPDEPPMRITKGS